MNMDRKKSSLVFGSHTRKNVLKGKNIRKYNDGADCFEDYWTDSGEQTSSSDSAEAQQVPSISNVRLRVSRPSERISQNSKASQFGITDPLDKSKFTKSPLKSVTSNTLEESNQHLSDELIFTSKHKESIQKNVTGILSSRSIISDSHCSENASSVSSATVQPSTSNVYGKKKQNKSTISFPKRNDKGEDASRATKSVQKTPKRKENIPRTPSVNTKSPLAKKRNNKLDETFVMHENASEINKMSTTKAKLNASNSVSVTEVQTLSSKPCNKRNNSVGLEDKTSNTYKTSLGNRIVKRISNTLHIRKTIFKNSHDAYDAEIIQMAQENEKYKNLKHYEKEHSLSKNSTSELNLAKEKKRESSASKNVIKSNDETHDKHNESSKEEVVSTGLSQRFYNLRSSEKISTEDELTSSELGNISHNASPHKNKSQTVNQNLSDSHKKSKNLTDSCRNEKETDDISFQRRKSRENKSALKRKTDVESITSAKKYILDTEDQNRSNSHSNISDANPVSYHKSNVQSDEVDKRNVSHVDNDNNDGDEASAFYIDENDDESSLRCDNESNKIVMKTNEKLKAAKTFSRYKSKTPAGSENRNSRSNDNGKKKHVNKTIEKLKTSKTFSRDKSKRSAEILGGEKRNNLSNDYDREKRVNKSNENLEASETFSQNTNKSVAEIPEIENRDNLSHKRNKTLHPSGDNHEHQASPGKKKSKKENTKQVTNNAVAIRRSSRHKFQPFQGWLGQRPIYQYINGNITLVGIEQGNGEDDAARRQLLKNISRQNDRKKEQKKKNKPMRFKLKDVVQNKKLHISLLKSFDSTPWQKEFESDKAPYRIKRSFETCNSAFGFIEIEKNEEKPVQYMPDDDIYLTVIRGKLQINIQDNISELKETDAIAIPRCMPYGLKNIGCRKARLVFCVGKFQFVESLAE